jgi:hypothetical protein
MSIAVRGLDVISLGGRAIAQAYQRGGSDSSSGEIMWDL